MCDTLLSKYEVTYKNSKFRRFLYADRNREQEYIKKEGDFFFFFLGRLPRTCMHVFIEKINLPCEERLSAFSIPQIRAPEKTLHPRWSIDVPILRDPIRSSSSPSSSSPQLLSLVRSPLNQQILWYRCEAGGSCRARSSCIISWPEPAWMPRCYTTGMHVDIRYARYII